MDGALCREGGEMGCVLCSFLRCFTVDWVKNGRRRKIRDRRFNSWRGILEILGGSEGSDGLKLLFLALVLVSSWTCCFNLEFIHGFLICLGEDG